MEKTIEKGNLIDLFGCLIPGMLMMLLIWFMVPDSRDFQTDGTIVSGLSILLVFVLASYAAGLVLMECAVILQELFGKVFDYFTNAKNSLYLKSGDKNPIFDDCNDINEIQKLTKKNENEPAAAYNHMEYWLITHGYNEYVERKRAYYLMNRSIVVIPLLFLIINPVLYFCVLRYRLGEQALTGLQWLYSGRIFAGCSAWKWVVLIGLFFLFLRRAGRQARLTVWEISMTFLKADKMKKSGETAAGSAVGSDSSPEPTQGLTELSEKPSENTPQT